MPPRIPFSYQGSKLAELGILREFIPQGSRIVEPFLGTGIVSKTFGSRGGCLGNDLNWDIAAIFWFSRARDKDFLELIREYCDDEKRTDQKRYYSLRDEYNKARSEGQNNQKRAALFYFLLNSCHAGLVRFGPNGFNVGYKLFLANGRRYDTEERVKLLLETADTFEDVHYNSCMPFLRELDHSITDYDVIYCDPPYANSSSIYMDSWSLEDLVELDDHLDRLARERGVYSVMSNYPSGVELKGRIAKTFERGRMASTNVIVKKNLVLTYGEPKNSERFT